MTFFLWSEKVDYFSTNYRGRMRVFDSTVTSIMRKYPYVIPAYIRTYILKRIKECRECRDLSWK